MSFPLRMTSLTISCLLMAGLVRGQEETPMVVGASASGTKIAVLDIDRLGTSSKPGRAIYEELEKMQAPIAAEREVKQKEIQALQGQAASDVLSADARERLQIDIKRKTTDLRRWLEDEQSRFETAQQQLEADFQAKVAPIIQQVMVQNEIGLLLRITPGFTFVVEPSLDITALVILAIDNAEEAPPPGSNP